MSEGVPEVPIEEAAAEAVETVETAAPEAAEIHANANEKEETPVLDIHPAHHAASTWKEFFIHIATIVLGLLIAVGLEQGVEHIHHMRQVVETRELLRQERESNRKLMVATTRAWRLDVASSENNLLVLEYLQKHPGTPQEKLPGRLTWPFDVKEHSHAVWDASQLNGVASLMPRDELQGDASLYVQLQRVTDRKEAGATAVIDAQDYALVDSNPSHLTPAQVAGEVALTQKALANLRREGLSLADLAARFPDFSPSIGLDETVQLRNPPDEQTEKLLAAATKLTKDRVQAEGGGNKLKLAPVAPDPGTN